MLENRQSVKILGTDERPIEALLLILGMLSGEITSAHP